MEAIDIENLIIKEEKKAQEALDSQLDTLREKIDSIWFHSRIQTCKDLLFAIKEKQCEENIQWLDLRRFLAGNS